MQRYTLTMPNVTRFWETLGSLPRMVKIILNSKTL
ncbi:hypothetical protein HDF16_005220 [Granulicella aggregans]|uniref:Uncharacterized protein n=1 Tax=Granulicella aggregans TaxID=474949 RepID=A0A7W8E6M4_9BACT|nr:hypothetical protein [Granulicella aggregans]